MKRTPKTMHITIDCGEGENLYTAIYWLEGILLKSKDVVVVDTHPNLQEKTAEIIVTFKKQYF